MKNSSQSPLTVSACALYQHTIFTDVRGCLAVSEYSRNLPFIAKRVFWTYDVPLNTTRGEHAHKLDKEYLVCIKGSVTVAIDDGSNKDEVTLNHPSLGLYVPQMIWASQFNHSPDAILMVIASGIYDEESYIKTYDDFLSIIKNSK
jgi:UDP-2-acetamido-3-amino-2,3-dideoxy-glucuronate N-acetyltransferase